MAKFIEKVIASIMSAGMAFSIMVPMEAKAAEFIDENGVYNSVTYDYEKKRITYLKKDNNMTEKIVKDFTAGEIYFEAWDDNSELGSACFVKPIQSTRNTIMAPLISQAVADFDEDGSEITVYNYKENQITNIKSSGTVTEKIVKDFNKGKIYFTAWDSATPELGGAYFEKSMQLADYRYWYYDILLNQLY